MWSISVPALLAVASIANAATSPSSATPTSSDTALPTSTTTTTLIAPGTACDDSEALFNCLTTSWQQCASGLWSIAIEGQGDDGLICSPSGLSYDMDIVYANGTAVGPADSRVGDAAISGTHTGTTGTASTATSTSTASATGVAGTNFQNSGASSIGPVGLAGWWTSNASWWISSALVLSAYLSC